MRPPESASEEAGSYVKGLCGGDRIAAGAVACTMHRVDGEPPRRSYVIPARGTPLRCCCRSGDDGLYAALLLTFWHLKFRVRSTGRYLKGKEVRADSICLCGDSIVTTTERQGDETRFRAEIHA